MTKTLGFILAAFILAVAIGGWFFPQIKSSFGNAAAGSTFNDAKVAAIAVNLVAPGANATSSSILNGDVNDRIITAEEVGCEGVGTSNAPAGGGIGSLTLTIATSAAATPVVNANTNTLPVITIATSTTQYTLASSTANTPGNGLVTNVWKAGSYLSFFTNATNTAACSFGVRYLAT